MGVEFALQGHQQLLETDGLLDRHCRIVGHHPFPSGPEYEGLVIDNYFADSAQHVSKPIESAGSVKKLHRASAVYAHEGVLGSPEKDVVGARKFKIVGAEVDSSEKALSQGLVLVGAPVAKRAALMMLTLRIAGLPIISSTLAARLAGNWTSVFMFRRCLPCLLGEI